MGDICTITGNVVAPARIWFVEFCDSGLYMQGNGVKEIVKNYTHHAK